MEKEKESNMVTEKVLIIKQTQDKELWVNLRMLAWRNDKKIFDGLDEHTFDMVEEEDVIEEEDSDELNHIHYKPEGR